LCRRAGVWRIARVATPRMPFVPLGQRKPTPLILDEDKAIIQQRQRDRDSAKIASHFGYSPGAAGYRFANHPSNYGQLRGSDIDPDGLAKRRDMEQAEHDGMWKSRSSPTLQSTAANVMEACHPLSIELKRWEKMAQRTQAQEMKDIEAKPMRNRPPPQEPPKIGLSRNGLVLFPKYMLIHNCHLKMTDLQRFQREQQEEARRVQEAQAGPDDEASPAGSQIQGERLEVEDPFAATGGRGPMRFDASWGAPLVRSDRDHMRWAGNPMASGGSMKTSNPFRMG